MFWSSSLRVAAPFPRRRKNGERFFLRPGEGAATRRLLEFQSRPRSQGFSLRREKPWGTRLLQTVMENLTSDVFEGRTSTGSELFSLLICLHATKFVLLSVFTLIETICPKICLKSRPRSAESSLPVNARRSKTSWN